MGKYLFKANALKRKWYDLQRRNISTLCRCKDSFRETPSRYFCVLASPEIAINFRHLRIFLYVFSVFIDKYTSSTNMFNKPH